MSERDPNKSEQAALAEGYAGVTLSELSQMSDVELATWQSGWKSGTDKHILAEKEWQRRIALRELKEQFILEERLANRNRWWTIASAVIGVLGTLLGTLLGVWLGKQSEPSHQLAAPQVSVTTPIGPLQQSTASTNATLAASGPTPLPTKKTP